jgi:hypothetical protein
VSIRTENESTPQQARSLRTKLVNRIHFTPENRATLDDWADECGFSNIPDLLNYLCQLHREKRIWVMPRLGWYALQDDWEQRIELVARHNARREVNDVLYSKGFIPSPYDS